MRKVFVLFLMSTVFSSYVIADDSERYKAAKFYKKKAQKSVNKLNLSNNSECHLMLSMVHINERHAKLKRIRTTGDRKVCKAAFNELQKYKSKPVKYDVPEKLLRITVAAND